MDYDKKIHPAIFWSLVCFFSVSVVFFVFIRYGGEEMAQFGKQNLSANSGEAMVVFDFGNGNERKFEGPIIENTKVWDIFQQAIATGGIDVSVNGNFVPQSIGGYKNGDNGKKWNFYLNSVKQELTPFDIKASSGDIAIFKFE